ncbi:ribose ABC transporter membrane protein [Micromonospora pattaloongensis]|uniref:Ribose ABC transporter membrane protein n=1 Tax=Micromonospora pattaloongensis TaxID=405436 RepID=A0A1H3SXL0_9ACTN|nr:ABC transporter permease [Micromonospora pattaloongensis]SDZ42664.1 ribose ABC transporter membrane protein [Micromonospora pattaloongensis]
MSSTAQLDRQVVEAPKRGLARLNIQLENIASGIVLVLLVIVLGAVSPAFLSFSNFLDIARVVAITGIIAVGMTLVIITGGIDLSVGSTVGLVGAVTASLVAGSVSDNALVSGVKLPVPLAVLVGLAVGALIGLINGLIITRTKIEPFMATLGTMIFVKGLLYLYTGGYPITFDPMPHGYAFLGQGAMFGVPTPVVFFAVAVAVLWWLSRRMSVGRAIYAIGGNPEAARLSGLKVDRTKVFVYTLLGLLAGLAGIILTSRQASADTVIGTGFELIAISGVVIGGTSLTGGRGSVIGSLIGVFIVGVIQNALNLFGASTQIQYVVTGLVLLLAISLDGIARRRRRT